MIQLPIFNHIVHQLETTDFANPAAGAPWNETIADQNLRHICSMNWTFIAAAGAANRYMQLVVQHGAGGFKYLFQSPVPIVALETCQFSAFPSAPYVPHVAGLGVGLFPLPNNLFLEPTDSIHLIIIGMLAADQLFGPTIQFKIWRTEP